MEVMKNCVLNPFPYTIVPTHAACRLYLRNSTMVLTYRPFTARPGPLALWPNSIVRWIKFDLFGRYGVCGMKSEVCFIVTLHSFVRT